MSDENGSKENGSVNIICIMDRSGSMAGIMDEIVGAFNGFVEDQKKIPGEATLTLVAFDDQYDLIHDCIPLQDVPELSLDTVRPRGMTGLNDAIGKTINAIPDDERTICLIQTDGHENASKEYSRDKVREMIERKTKAGWDFNFTAAGVDAFEASAGYGIDRSKIKSISKDVNGIRSMSSDFSTQTMSYRTQ